MPTPMPTPMPPPLAVSEDDLLGELDLSESESESESEAEEVLVPAASNLPRIEIDENTPVGPAYPTPAPVRRAAPAAAAPPPAAPAPVASAPVAPARASVPAEPSRPPLATHPPQNTLVSNQDEANDLRRRISAPGLSEDVEMDLEEVDDFDQPAQARFLPSAGSDTTAPEPMLRPERSGATEVEVPIDIEVAPGTTRISLNIKLLLNLRRR